VTEPVVGSTPANEAPPGRGIFGPTVDRVDDDFDRALEIVRNNGTLARVFQVASALGDFSLIWHLFGLARGTTSDRRAMQAVALSALLGAESLIVNQGVKRLFRRERPTASGDSRFEVRTPSTSSFPSGHASSAVFAAMILSAYGGRRWSAVWYSVAAIVALSRAVVRIHHASDVVGGVAVGAVLGSLARRAVKRLV
jgi:undecaprenyl-diphosphatase